MISDQEMRAVCAKALSRTDLAHEHEFLFALRAACEQYLRERSVVVVYSKPSPERVQTSKATNSRVRVA